MPDSLLLDSNVISGIIRKSGNWEFYESVIRRNRCLTARIVRKELKDYKYRHPELATVHQSIQDWVDALDDVPEPPGYSEKVADVELKFPAGSRRDRRDNRLLALVLDTDIVLVTGDQKLAEKCGTYENEGRLRFISHHTHAPDRRKQKHSRTGRRRQT